MYLIGEFREKDAAASAIRSLRAGGVQPVDLDVFSEEPVEFPRGVLDRPSRMFLVSVLGAIGFGALATTFIWWTQQNYRLPTGGMPIFSFWATGVITYEMTMLGAILATFGWFLWESGLLRKRDKSAPVPEVPPGAMCIRVRCRGAEAAQATDVLRRAGAVDVERRGDA
ncbi:MAG TPA: quinol:electron acceptor oxidoreductase subunit ActD [Bryobacteraceae bacterium]